MKGNWKEDREKRIVQYIKDGLTEADIGKLEGLRADYAGVVKRGIARKHGLTIKPRGHSETPVTDASRTMRGRLGSALNSAMVVKKMSKIEITRTIGVPRKLINKAIERPNHYDWKISEMERLAKVWGISLNELLIRLSQEEYPQWK